MALGIFCFCIVTPYLAWMSWTVFSAVVAHSTLYGPDNPWSSVLAASYIYGFVNLFIFAALNLLGVKCIRHDEARPFRLFERGADYWRAFFYALLAFVIMKIVSNSYRLGVPPFATPLLMLFINPLLVLGYAYSVETASPVAALIRSCRSAFKRYWTIFWLHIVYSLLLGLLSFTVFGIVIAAPLGGIVIALAARDLGDLEARAAPVRIEPELQAEGAWPPAPSLPESEKVRSGGGEDDSK